MMKFKLYPRRGGYSNNFDPKQDPRVPNVFAAASFRFGHTMIPEDIVARNADSTIPTGNSVNSDGFKLDINDVQFRFDLLKYENGFYRNIQLYVAKIYIRNIFIH